MLIQENASQVTQFNCYVLEMVIFCATNKMYRGVRKNDVSVVLCAVEQEKMNQHYTSAMATRQKTTSIALSYG